MPFKLAQSRKESWVLILVALSRAPCCVEGALVQAGLSGENSVRVTPPVKSCKLFEGLVEKPLISQKVKV